MDKLRELKKKIKGEVYENTSMSSHTLMGVGGVVDFFFEAKAVEELAKAVEACRELNLPYLVLGGGANVIFSDIGFPGLVIKNSASGLNFLRESGEVIAQSGTPLSKLITESATHGLSGLEPLYGIPGTVGGAVYGNAGAHGNDIGSFVRSVTLIDQKGKIIRLTQKAMEFGYRTSKLKRNSTKNKPVILSLKFQFVHRKKEDILRDINQHSQWRLKHQPLGSKTSGSIFKNPSGTSAGEKTRSAGYLLEKSTAKKLSQGEAKVSALHANWIINKGKANARDIRILIDKMRDKVREKFGVNLEEEIEYFGRW